MTRVLHARHRLWAAADAARCTPNAVRAQCHSLRATERHTVGRLLAEPDASRPYASLCRYARFVGFADRLFECWRTQLVLKNAVRLLVTQRAWLRTAYAVIPCWRLASGHPSPACAAVSGWPVLLTYPVPFLVLCCANAGYGRAGRGGLHNYGR